MHRSVIWPEIRLDRSPHAPSLRQQIAMQIASAVRSGALPGGARLPSSRVLASALTVSRGTVVDAYEALLETGMLIAAARRGLHVAHPSPSIPSFSSLKRACVAAHYPARIVALEDGDGTALYLNVIG